MQDLGLAFVGREHSGKCGMMNLSLCIQIYIILFPGSPDCSFLGNETIQVEMAERSEFAISILTLNFRIPSQSFCVCCVPQYQVLSCSGMKGKKKSEEGIRKLDLT